MAALVVLVLALLPARVALGVIPPDFAVDPTLPIAGEQATFTPSNIPAGATVTWQYEPPGSFVSDQTHTFAAAGSYVVTMRVAEENNGPVTDYTKTVDVNARPVASFDYSPTLPDPNEWVVFQSTSTDADDSIASFAWNFGDGTPGSTAPNPTHKFPAPGQYDVTLVVTDQDGTTDSVKHQVDVRDPSIPTAAFHRDPDLSVLLETGQEATFTSDSVASPGSTLSWEIDGVSAGSGTSVTHSFATPGNHVVRLEVAQPNGKSDVAESTFRVNAPPIAGFVWTPGSPVAGGEVQLYSTSVDAEGPLADQSQAWDLDGDGQFDDAFGPSATQSFTAGDHLVSLRVTDSEGVTRIITRTITVAAPAIAPAPAPPAATPLPAPPPRLMSPFPTVRLLGTILPRGSRIKLVEVRGAPFGARVTVRCTGRGCPFRSRRRVAEAGRVRLSNFGRVLAAGTRIEVFVRAPGVIGKYTSFRIRAGKGPARSDRCLMPGASAPTRCT